ncbi:MAG: SusC/RagA family TonB-linked outer membrane protein [Chryseotalea sp.]
MVKGTTNGTMTDANGNYKLNIPQSGGSLVFSFVGMQTQEVPIGDRTVVDVTLGLDVTQLSEVVVTALGVEKQSRELGYAISTVSSEDLTVARESNILNSLQGKVTGVTITQSSGNLGGSTKILVRGVNSLAGNNNPLWVVDGVPINDNQDNTSAVGNRISGNRDFANGASIINPDDVESISVLKGAAASALYGSRAAAGVIVVTSKKGKNRKGHGPSITLNSSLRFDNLFRVPDFQNEYGAGQNYKYDSSSVFNNWGPKIAGQLVTEAITGKTVPLKSYGENYKDFYRTGKTLVNNVSVSDANEKSDYRLSLTSLNQNGILPNAELDRITVSLNAGTKHSKKVSSRFGVQYINTETIGTGVAGANDPNIISWSSFVRTTNFKNYKPWIDDFGGQLGTVNNLDNNPFWIQYENKNERKDDRFLGNFEATYNILDNFNLLARVGYDYDRDSRLLTNRKGTRSRATGDFLTDDIFRTQINVDILSNYFAKLTSDLELKALVGYNFNKRKFSSKTVFAQSLAIAELFNPSNASTVSTTFGFSEQVLFGAFGEVGLSYRDWATLTLTGRNDWNSTLPKDKRSFFYPSASLAVVVTDALKLESNVLSYAKLRTSFAEVGNGTNPYLLNFQYFPVAQASGQYSLNVNFPFNGLLAFRSSTQIPPKSLRPESQQTFEIGTELQFFKGRIGLDVAYFSSTTKDQIIALPVSPSSGFSTSLINAGNINTSGVEISLNADVVKIGGFTWSSIVNFTQTESVVKSLAPNLNRVVIASEFNGIQVVAEPGKEYQLFGTPYLRDQATGKLILNSTTGMPQAGTNRTFGSVMPDFTMGFINNFTFKNFTLTSTIDWRSGGLLSSATVLGLWQSGAAKETAINREGSYVIEGLLQNQDGTFRENDIPVRSTQTLWNGLATGSVAESFIFDASFVKLRELGISYSLPNSLVSKTPFKGLQVGIEGRNLALLYSKVPHIDPEATLFGSGADGMGVERNTVPSTRSIGFNLRITL